MPADTVVLRGSPWVVDGTLQDQERAVGVAQRGIFVAHPKAGRTRRRPVSTAAGRVPPLGQRVTR
jgi:hypothetical protein